MTEFHQKNKFFSLAFKIIVLLAICALLKSAGAAQISEKPELVVESGHSGLVTSVAYSGNGKIMVSGGLSGVLKVWDTENYLNLRTINLSSELREPVSISDNGRYAFTPSVGECAIWDLETGEKIQGSECGNGENINANRKFNFATQTQIVGNQGSFAVYDFKNRRQINLADKITNTHTVALSPNGQLLALTYEIYDEKTNKSQNSVMVYRAQTGERLYKLDVSAANVEVLQFSGDGKFLAASEQFSDDKQKSVYAIWDMTTGAQTKSVPLGGDCERCAMAFSGDNTILATGTDKGEVRLHKLTGGETETIKVAESKQMIFALAFAPSNGALTAGDSDGNIFVVDPKTKERQSLGARVLQVSNIQISRDSRRLFVGHGLYSNSARLFNTAGSFETELLPSFPNRFMIADFVFGADDNTFAVSDLETYRTGVEESIPNASGFIKRGGSNLPLTLKANPNEIFTSLAFSPDGKLLATGSVEDLLTAQKQVGMGNENEVLKIWDTATGKLVRRLKSDFPASSAGGAEDTYVGFSGDGQNLLSASRDKMIRVWDLKTGRQIRVFKNLSEDVSNFYRFSPDGKYLVLSTFGSDAERRKIKLWDIEKGTVAQTFAGHAARTNSVCFTGDGKILISGANDGEIKFWSAESGKELANLVLMNDTDWIVTTPEGLFDGTQTAWKQLLWRFNRKLMNVAPIEAFFNEFYYPGLLEEILQGKPMPPPKKNLAEVDVRPPSVSIIGVNRQSVRGTDNLTVDKPTVKVAVGVAENPRQSGDPKFPPTGGARDLRLFRNGSLVKIWNKSVFDLTETDGCKQFPPTQDVPVRRTVCEADVQTVAGDNDFSAYVFNGDNVKSRDAELKVKGADSLKRNGTLYVLAIGANEYANPNYNLRYAVVDVESIAQALKAQQTALGNYAKTEVIELTNQNATKANIIAALNLFGSNKTLPANAPADLQKIKKLLPEDALVIYYAGHGTASKDSFYLIPHDGFPTDKNLDEKARLEKIYAASVSDRDLEDALESVDAGKILMVIDACNSGQALESDEKRRGPMNSRGLAQLAYEKGMYILTAAQSQQSALEVSKLGHGLLTYALLEGFKKAERDSAGNITERKWLDYAAAQVPQLQVAAMQTRSAENRTLPPAQKRSELAVATGDNTNLPPEKRGLQVPRIFYRRELETRPLVVAKP